MKIQISKEKIIDDAVCIWDKLSPGVDLVVDLKKVEFQSDNIDAIYIFHALSRMNREEIVRLLTNIKSCLKKYGEIYIIENDFEYLCRSIVGGDLTLKEFNESYADRFYFSKEYLVELLSEIGFDPAKQKVWYDVEKFSVKPSEIIISASNNTINQ